MNKYILAIMVLLAVGPALAQSTYTVDQIPDVHRTDGRRYVSDPGNILSRSAVSRLDEIAGRVEARTGSETAVVVVPSIGYDTPEDFAVRLFAKWGIGKKGKDNGLLILLATEDRTVRFEVGYGLEGVLTDAISKRIQTQRMNPYFTRGDWDEGLIAGLTAVEEILTDPTSELLAEQQPAASAEDMVGALIMLLLVGIMIAAVVIGQRRLRKCPRCGHRMKIENETTRKISPTVRETTTFYRCPNCGYTKNRTSRHDIGAAVAGGTIAGGLGRGSGGGSFGGGWGGGRSGGGGATSRF